MKKTLRDAGMEGDCRLILSTKNGSCKLSVNFRTILLSGVTLYISGFVLDSLMRPLKDGEFVHLIQNSVSGLQKLNGEFCGILVEHDKYILFSDRATVRKIFFSMHRDYLYVSDNPDTVAELCPRVPDINFFAVSEMLKQGGLSRNHTLYENIFTPAIGEIAEFRRQGFIFCSYDSVFGKGVVDDRPGQQIAEAIISELRQCISNAYRHHSSSLSATLTAGLDSRLLVGIAQSQGINVPLIVTDTCGSINEYAILQPLIEYLQPAPLLENHPLVDEFYQTYAENCLKESGYSCVLHTWFAPVAEQIAHKKRLWMMGIGGDNLLRFFNDSQKTLPLLFAERNYDSLLEELFTHSDCPDALLHDDFTEMVNNHYKAILEGSLRPFFNTPRGIMDWRLQNRLGNNILYFHVMYRKIFTGFSPFLCGNVLDKLFSLPISEAALGPNMYSHLFDRVDPKLLTFPSTRSLDQKDMPRITPSKLHNQMTLDWICLKLRDGVMVQKGYIDKDKMDTYFNDLRQRNIWITGWLRSVFAMELWLQNFERIKRAKSPFLRIFT
ncbi:MAG: hypothetical protein FWH04_03685 [Oscillospiraceae bacterium]|nr:hypothetical protein [Oscillospiraceae bacterium]